GASAYANSAKTKLVGVNDMLLGQHGAVSAQVAVAMAEGIRERLGATFALSLTGVAGPEGGSPAKPVGTVFCGVASAKGARSVALQLSGNRGEIREQAARRALVELGIEIG